MSYPPEQAASRESSRHPQGSQHGARNVQPQWSQGAMPVQPQWSQGARNVQPQWPQGARNVYPQWPQGATNVEPQWLQRCNPYRSRQSSSHQRQTQGPSTGQLTQSSSTEKQKQGPSTGQLIQGPSTGQQTQGPSTGQITQSRSTGQQTQGPSTRQLTQGPSTGQQTQCPSTGQQTQCPSIGQLTQSPSAGQQTQGPSTGHQRRGSSKELATPVVMAQTSWRQSIRDWYPDLHRKTYFLPPSYFNKVSYDVQTVAGQLLLVPQEAPNHPDQVRVVLNPSGPPPQVPAPPLASRVWPDHPVPPGPLPVVYRSDAKSDNGMRQVLHCIRVLADRERLVMLVLSQLEFRKYLDNQVDPISAAAIRLLPRPATLEPKYARGEFDVLMVNEHHGLIAGEVKSVGADLSKIPDLNKAVVKAVERAVKQLNKQDTVLRHLVSDLPPVKVTKTLMLPNVTSTQLFHALNSNSQVQQDLCECLGAPDTTCAVSRCLCNDDMGLSSSQWWQRAVTDHGPDTNMSPDLYEVLVARFCGPATTIEVPTVTTPRRAVPLKTMSEAVALTGLTMAMLTLYPEQVELVSRPGLPRVFLWGPPGTGKTVILVLKGMQWGHQGKDVHLLSSHRHSRAAIFLMEHQLHHSLGCDSTATPTPPTSTPTPASTPASCQRVYTHFYDFEHNEGDVGAAVEELASAASDMELFVIADEAIICDDWSNTSGRFAEFCTRLTARVPALHLWAAAVERDVTPACLCVETVTTPVRCPPAVVTEVSRSRLIDDRSLLRYTGRPSPAPTDGPKIREILHWENRISPYPSPGHTGDYPEDCERCADDIANLMEELRVGQPGSDLQYRDVIILCGDPRDDIPAVTRLRARGLPVQVVTSREDQTAIRNVALALRDAVTVTDYDVVRGLERRVVTVMGWEGGTDRLIAMSRCTSLLVWAGGPL